jgi:hypothetical protein
MAKRTRKKRKSTEPTRPEWCSSCGTVTTRPGGVCACCVLRLRAEEAAAAAPPPPVPAPEPVTEVKTVFLGAPPGCFKCGGGCPGLLCDGCNAELHGLPRREGDPIIRYPKPLSRCG